MWDRYALDEAAETVLREYNPCHAPNSGKFCSRRAAGSLTGILGKRFGSSGPREELAMIAKSERTQRRVEQRVARATGRPVPSGLSKQEIADEYRATRRQRAFDREGDLTKQRATRREWRVGGKTYMSPGSTIPASLEDLTRAGKARSDSNAGRANRGIGPDFFRRAARAGGRMSAAQHDRFEARLRGGRRKKGARYTD